MIDRSTKIILIVIAAGLWANVAVQGTRPAVAQGIDVEDRLRAIEENTSEIHAVLSGISKGECLNRKLC